MEQIPSSTKLQLLQQIREKQKRDQMDLQQREHILYGSYFENRTPEVIADPEEIPISFFRLRMLGAVLLFLGYMLLKLQGLSFGEVDAEWVIDCINEDTKFSLDGIDKITYNEAMW